MDNIVIILNGEKTQCPKTFTIADIIRQKGLADKNIVAELDGEVFSKEEFADHTLTENCHLELIRFVGGG